MPPALGRFKTPLPKTHSSRKQTLSRPSPPARAMLAGLIAIV